MPPEWLFEGWAPLAKAILGAVAMYLLVVACVRVSGKRSTSQMNNFDWIVTVSIGSMVGAAIMQPDTALATVAVGIGTLFALQWLVTRLTSRTDWAQRLVRAQPTILFQSGQFLRENMRRERINEAEIYAAVRNEGHDRLADVHAVVLENDAQLSVVVSADAGGGEALDEKRGLRVPGIDADRNLQD